MGASSVVKTLSLNEGNIPALSFITSSWNVLANCNSLKKTELSSENFGKILEEKNHNLFFIHTCSFTRIMFCKLKYISEYKLLLIRISKVIEGNDKDTGGV